MIKLRIVVGLPTFDKILDSSQYTDLRGGLLEAMGTLFQNNVKMYLYPYTDMNSGEVIYPEDAHFTNENQLLWKYLIETKKIIVLNGIPSRQLELTSAYITQLIENADEKLRDFLPPKVYSAISQDKLFGYGKNLSE